MTHPIIAVVIYLVISTVMARVGYHCIDSDLQQDRESQAAMFFLLWPLVVGMTLSAVMLGPLCLLIKFVVTYDFSKKIDKDG